MRNERNLKTTQKIIPRFSHGLHHYMQYIEVQTTESEAGTLR